MGKRRGEVVFLRANPTVDTSMRGCCSCCAQGRPCESHTKSNNTVSQSTAFGGSEDQIKTYGQKAAYTFAATQAKNAAAYAVTSTTGIGTSLLGTAAASFNVYAFVAAVVIVAIALLLGEDPEDIEKSIANEFDDYAGDFLDEMPGVDLPDVDLPRLPDIGGGGIPDNTAPEGGGIAVELPDSSDIKEFVEEIDWAQIAKNWECLKDPVQVLVAGIEKKVMCQKKVTRADGTVGWDYMLEDGSVVQGSKSLKTPWLPMMMAGGGLLLLAIGMGGKKKESKSA